MPSLGPNCHELRIVDENTNWRILITLTREAVVISGGIQKEEPDHAQERDKYCAREAEKIQRTNGGIKMQAKKRKKLEAAGWKVAGTREFLNLSDTEAQFLEIKLSLVKMLRSCRERNHLTQLQLAKRIKSSQSRVAKMEAGDPSVSIDLLMRSLLAAGAKPRELGRALSAGRS